MKRRSLIALLLVAVLTLSACSSGGGGVTNDTLSGTKWAVDIAQSDSSGFDQSAQEQLDQVAAEIQLHFDANGTMKFIMAEADGPLGEGVTEDQRKLMLDIANSMYETMVVKWEVKDGKLVTTLDESGDDVANYDISLDGDTLILTQTDNPEGQNEKLVLNKR